MTYLSSRDLELKLSASVKNIVEKTLQAFKESIITSKLKILQIIMWNIGMAQKAKETRSGCLVHIVQ